VNALVTGAGGFLGLHIVERLVAEGYSVRALCRRESPRLAALGVEVVCADLRNREHAVAACRGIDLVLHAAGVAGLGGPWKRFFEANTLATRHIIEGCLAHRVGRLVYTSSPSVTFDGKDQCGVDESVGYPPRWLCHYAKSKALAEQEVLAANGQGSLSTCVLRPHLMWGPNDRHLIPRLIQRSRAGRLYRVGDGTNVVDTLYIDNAAEAHLLAARALDRGSPVAGSAYFLSQGAPVNCWQWIDQLLALAGCPRVDKSLSFKAAWRWGCFFELLWRAFRLSGDPPMTRFLAAQLATSHYFDIGRARRDFGFRPRVSSAEGLRRMADHLKHDGVARPFG
jgi:nucleoside-diphosphate-sugar epimerase